MFWITFVWSCTTAWGAVRQASEFPPIDSTTPSGTGLAGTPNIDPKRGASTSTSFSRFPPLLGGRYSDVTDPLLDVSVTGAWAASLAWLSPRYVMVTGRRQGPPSCRGSGGWIREPLPAYGWRRPRPTPAAARHAPPPPPLPPPPPPRPPPPLPPAKGLHPRRDWPP